VPHVDTDKLSELRGTFLQLCKEGTVGAYVRLQRLHMRIRGLQGLAGTCICYGRSAGPGRNEAAGPSVHVAREVRGPLAAEPGHTVTVRTQAEAPHLIASGMQ
jgi:hypothetical protein